MLFMKKKKGFTFRDLLSRIRQTSKIETHEGTAEKQSLLAAGISIAPGKFIKFYRLHRFSFNGKGF